VIRAASMPFSLTRYVLVFTARAVASLLPPFSFPEALPTIASFASGLRCRSSAISSRLALHYLSTLTGRRASRSKCTAHRSLVVGLAVSTGAATVTVVVAEAVWPLSSATLHVMVIGPTIAPAVERVTVESVPVIEPELAL